MEVVSTNEFASPPKCHQREQGVHASENSEVKNEKEIFSYSVHTSDQSQQCNGSNHEDEKSENCRLYHRNCSEHRINCFSPTLPVPGHITDTKSLIKVSRDSGCFDDIPITTLTINENSFPNQTSPTVSDRSSSSTGFASHTDETGIHGMNEDSFFEEECSEKSRDTSTEKHSSSTENISSDQTEKSECPHQEGINKPLLVTCQSNNIETKIRDMDRKNPQLVGKHVSAGIGSSSQSRRISGSKFNSARSIFEQNAN